MTNYHLTFTYTLVTASQKLQPYFEAHKVTIPTNQPLKNVLQWLDASRRLLKWAVELSQYDLIFEVRRAIKAQALANFLAESISAPADASSPPPSWNLYVEGSSTKDGSGAGLIT